MIGWLNPAALWALPLAILPILIHLLRLHRSERVLFPSLRFITPSRTAAVRLRLPSDIWLLLVRVAIVVLAVTALAGPVAVTRGRVAAWNARTARAVVVDVSESMRTAGTAPAARDAAQAELKTATYGREVDAATLGDAVTRATAWLSAAPPAKREIVVISDFQRGALDRAATQGVPDGIGVRLVPVGQAETSRVVRGPALLGASAAGGRTQVFELSSDATTLTLEAQPQGADGFRFVTAPAAGPEVERLRRVVAAAGTPAGATTQPIAFRFRGAETVAGTVPITARWMLRTVLFLREDVSLAASIEPLAGASAASTSAADAVVTPWVVVVRDRHRSPRLRAAASGNELLLDIDDDPGSLFAAATVRAALIARQGIDGYAEHEIARIDPVTLDAWNRPAGDVSGNGWRTADATDARWCWGAVVILLALEQWLRARSVRRTPVEATRAAA